MDGELRPVAVALGVRAHDPQRFPGAEERARVRDGVPDNARDRPSPIREGELEKLRAVAGVTQLVRADEHHLVDDVTVGEVPDVGRPTLNG
jgi:hypothetical protein